MHILAHLVHEQPLKDNKLDLYMAHSYFDGLQKYGKDHNNELYLFIMLRNKIYPQNQTATEQQNRHLNSMYLLPCFEHFFSNVIGQQSGQIRSFSLNALSILDFIIVNTLIL